MRNKQCLCGIYDDIRTAAKIVASYDYFCSDFILFFYFKPRTLRITTFLFVYFVYIHVINDYKVSLIPFSCKFISFTE